MKEIRRPNCGGLVGNTRIGRAATNISVINICDALQSHRSIQLAAEKLGCSRGLIYKILKLNGLTPLDVI